MSDAPLRLVGLISGAGTTVGNWLDWRERGDLQASLVGVVSSRSRGEKNARICDRLVRAGIPLAFVPRHRGESDVHYSSRVTAAVDAFQPGLVGMAGWLWRWLFPPRYVGRVVNIHPALLPGFGGKGYFGHHVHEAVLAARVAESGCTIHLATHDYDAGPILLQRRVPVLADDTPDVLAARVFVEECIAYPTVINHIARGEWALPLTAAT